MRGDGNSPHGREAVQVSRQIRHAAAALETEGALSPGGEQRQEQPDRERHDQLHVAREVIRIDEGTERAREGARRPEPEDLSVPGELLEYPEDRDADADEGDPDDQSAELLPIAVSLRGDDEQD